MDTVIFLLILAAVIYGGYRLYKRHKAKQASSQGGGGYDRDEPPSSMR